LLHYKKVIERTGKTEPEELHKLTGLSLTKIKQYLFAATLPKPYQKLIDSGEIPLNSYVRVAQFLAMLTPMNCDIRLVKMY
jgi:hypothetical protein